MNGRRYRLVPAPVGTHCRSCRTSSSTASTNVSTGSSGMASRRAEALNRAAFCSGRNSATDPSDRWYAFMPSKISCP